MLGASGASDAGGESREPGEPCRMARMRVESVASGSAIGLCHVGLPRSLAGVRHPSGCNMQTRGQGTGIGRMGRLVRVARRESGCAAFTPSRCEKVQHSAGPDRSP